MGSVVGCFSPAMVRREPLCGKIRFSAELRHLPERGVEDLLSKLSPALAKKESLEQLKTLGMIDRRRVEGFCRALLGKPSLFF
ncbi:hypothetical protein ACOJBO_02085 [Rhizobium beringeri]